MATLFTRDEEAAPPPKRKGSRLFIASLIGAILAAGIWIGGVVLGFWATVDSQLPEVEITRDAPVAAADEGCAGWDADTELPTQGELAAAPPVVWGVVGGMPAPASPAAGPVFTAPVRWCYAPTHVGALVAVSNFFAEYSDRDTSRVDLARYNLADTPSRTALLEEAAKRSPEQGPGNTGRPTLRGYHFLAYSGGAATIDLVHEWRGSLVSGVYELRYEGGDWRVVLPDGWMFPQRIVGVDLDTAYYTPWSAQ